MSASSPPLRERLRAGRRPLVIGHRGAMGTRPENTIASFEHAVEQGADAVELDVHLSRDGRPVVIHDETLERTTNGHGPVREHTLAELQRLDAGGWFDPAFTDERIPSFDDVLAWASGRDVSLDVEIKHGPLYYEGIESAVLHALRRHGLLHRALVSSFDHPTVARVKEAEPGILAGVLYVGRPCDPVAVARAAHADVLLPHWAHVMGEDVERAHDAGLALGTWATSDPAELRRLIGLGVDAIATNDPDLLRQCVDAAETHATVEAS